MGTVDGGMAGRKVSPGIESVIRWSGWILFSLFCLRLVFTSANYHGLPGNETFALFWAMVVGAGVSGLIFPRPAILGYLGLFPLISAAHEAKWIGIGNLAPLVFAALFLGWLARRLILRTEEAPSLMDLSVSALLLAGLLSTIFSLAHPSATNSFSVAFSIPSWPEKTEFSGLFAGFHFVAGLVLFGMIRSRTAARVDLRELAVVLGVQVVLLISLVVGELGWKVAVGVELGRDAVSLPFGCIHNLGGPATLFAGFFLGLAAVWIRSRRFSGPLLLAAGGACFVLIVSVSKGAWLALLLVMALIAIWWRGWRVAGWVAMGVLVLGLLLRFTLGSEPQTSEMGTHLSALVSPEKWAENHTVYERLAIWKKAVAVAAAHPLSGVGIGAFSSLLEHYGDPAFVGSKQWPAYMFAEKHAWVPGEQATFNGFHSHNDVLEMAAGIGIPSTVLFLFLVGALIVAGWRADFRIAPLATASAFALLCFAMVAMIDSRLHSFPDSLLFWQFAGILAIAVGAGEFESPKWVPILPALAPVFVVAGAVIAFATGALPGDRTFGVWNWRLPEQESGFRLAKEAQFVVPAEEPLSGLRFRLPEKFVAPSTHLRVEVDGVSMFDGVLENGPGVTLPWPSNETGHRRIVRVEVSGWAGRGTLNTPFGVKPYAVILEKVRPGSGE